MCVCMCMGNYESVENALNVVIAIVQGASVLRRECSTWTTSSAGWSTSSVLLRGCCPTIYMWPSQGFESTWGQYDHNHRDLGSKDTQLRCTYGLR